MLRFVVATRCVSEADFLSLTLTGKSLSWLRGVYPIHVNVAYGQCSGLAPVYNAAIELADADDILVFMHDDVRIDDWQIMSRLAEGLRTFGVIGVAGNTIREPSQLNWWGKHCPASGQFMGCGVARGAIAYADGRHEYWSGEPCEVKQLDGLFLAAFKSTLQEHAVRFDPRFQYHLYDVDFCRQCEQAGIAMGVWPIALSHQSSGQLGSAWIDAGRVYLDKWGE